MRRDSAGRLLDRVRWNITRETHDDIGQPFIGHDRAAIRYQGGIVAYYGGSAGTFESARRHAEMALENRLHPEREMA